MTFSTTSLLALASAAIVASAQDTNFTWSSISPSGDLQWQECYGAPFQCARLEVPLDYNNADATDKAAIALIRIPANVSADDPSYRGPVLFNPGGPGGSGVTDTLSLGPYYQRILGPQFDIVGFDPRGVSYSTPPVRFFESQLERIANNHNPGSKDLNATEDTLGQFLAKSLSTNALAQLRAGDILPYMTTDYTARDMLSIVEAHGRDKLMYWGVSYGTALGITFASMFPDKIERAVIDGVADGDMYYKADWDWTEDADKAIQIFCDFCHTAGADKCPLYADSSDEICQTFNSVLEGTRLAPVAIPPHETGSYGVLDYVTLKFWTYRQLYFPYPGFVNLATGYAALQAGNATVLWDIINGSNSNSTDISAFCTPIPEQEQQFAPDNYNDMQTTVVCNDGAPNGEVSGSLDEAKDYVSRTMGTSSFGAQSAGFHLGCAGWPVKPHDNQFRGPVGADNTSFPIMFIGNEADPITPIANAKRMQEKFSGSGLLSRDFVGHVSWSAPSNCTSLAIQTYFVNGTLPEEGKSCPIDWSPFDDPSTHMLN